MTARPLSLQVLELARSSALTDDEQLAELASAVVLLVVRTGIPWAGVFTALAAGLSISAATGKPVALWSEVAEPEPGTWYDFVDLATGKVGQCCKRTEDTWLQAPVGDQVVILSYESVYERFRRSMRRATEGSAGAR